MLEDKLKIIICRPSTSYNSGYKVRAGTALSQIAYAARRQLLLSAIRCLK